MFLHVSVILSEGRGELLSQHALQQVSRPTPRVEVEGHLARGGTSRPTTKGLVEGDLARGVSRPTPKGEVEGDGEVIRPTPGGCLFQGGLFPGGCHLRGDACSGGWRPPVTATAAGGTHPSGMHSCYH